MWTGVETSWTDEEVGWATNTLSGWSPSWREFYNRHPAPVSVLGTDYMTLAAWKTGVGGSDSILSVPAGMVHTETLTADIELSPDQHIVAAPGVMPTLNITTNHYHIFDMDNAGDSALLASVAGIKLNCEFTASQVAYVPFHVSRNGAAVACVLGDVIHPGDAAVYGFNLNETGYGLFLCAIGAGTWSDTTGYTFGVVGSTVADYVMRNCTINNPALDCGVASGSTITMTNCIVQNAKVSDTCGGAGSVVENHCMVGQGVTMGVDGYTPINTPADEGVPMDNDDIFPFNDNITGGLW